MNTVTTEKEMFLHIKADGSRALYDCDLSEWSENFGVAIGKVVCSITYEDIEGADPRGVLIGKLEEQIAKERADSQRKVNHLLDQISKLQCLEYQPEPGHAG
ncbi:hypothetical protein QM298_14190 [Pseudomonas mendocina]|nr:hypothetical protein [Pseudomonas mendocina]MDV5862029.1 hypothetical protein [Pseudomonas mendocina]